MAKAKNGSPTEAAEPKTERRLMYEVRLKPGHPSGVYRRAGGVFHRGSPTYVEFPIPALVNDPWLIVAAEPVEIEWNKEEEVSEAGAI